jgi:hypothetical protein
MDLRLWKRLEAGLDEVEKKEHFTPPEFEPCILYPITQSLCISNIPHTIHSIQR